MARDLEGAKAVLLEGLDDAHPAVSTSAIVAWAGVATEGEFFDKVGARLDAPNLAVQRAALEGLRSVSRSARAVDAVARKLRMGPNPVRIAAVEALEAMACDEVLEPLVEALSHRQLPVRNRAAEALTNLATALKVDLARAVLWLLHSRDVNVRRLAVEIVRKVGDPKGELTPRLLKLLRDEDWWVRERVLDAVVEIAGPSLTRHLVEYLQDPNDVIRRHALGGLVRLRDPRSMGAVIRAARDDADWWVREVAVEALGAMGDPRATPYLLELLRDAKELQVACLDALRLLGAAEAAPDVLSPLASPASEVRLGCVRFLAALDDLSHAATLSSLEHDESPLVRAAARDLLQRWNFVAEARPSRAPSARLGARPHAHRRRAREGRRPVAARGPPAVDEEARARDADLADAVHPRAGARCWCRC
ncbi:MAG: HEAT repeat domain-containing protein [Polyangiales bacterium]